MNEEKSDSPEGTQALGDGYHLRTNVMRWDGWSARNAK